MAAYGLFRQIVCISNQARYLCLPGAGGIGAGHKASRQQGSQALRLTGACPRYPVTCFATSCLRLLNFSPAATISSWQV